MPLTIGQRMLKPGTTARIGDVEREVVQTTDVHLSYRDTDGTVVAVPWSEVHAPDPLAVPGRWYSRNPGRIPYHGIGLENGLIWFCTPNLELPYDPDEWF